MCFDNERTTQSFKNAEFLKQKTIFYLKPSCLFLFNGGQYKLNNLKLCNNINKTLMTEYKVKDVVDCHFRIDAIYPISSIILLIVLLFISAKQGFVSIHGSKNTKNYTLCKLGF